MYKFIHKWTSLHILYYIILHYIDTHTDYHVFYNYFILKIFELLITVFPEFNKSLSFPG